MGTHAKKGTSLARTIADLDEERTLQARAVSTPRRPA